MSDDERIRRRTLLAQKIFRENSARFDAEKAHKEAQRKRNRWRFWVKETTPLEAYDEFNTVELEKKPFFKIPRFSIRARILTLIFVLSSAAMLGGAYASYQYSMENTMVNAKMQGQILFDMFDSARDHFKFSIRKKFMDLRPKGAFVPELQSGFYALRGIADNFHKRNPDMAFRQAAMNPLEMSNLADDYDRQVIKMFQADPTKDDLEGQIMKNGDPYYFYAKPTKVKSKRCLKCHGKPENAPDSQRARYGTTTGYGWKIGDIVASYIVYVPLKEAIVGARMRALTLFGISAAGLAVLVIALWSLINSRIISPLNFIRERAEELAVGTDLNVPLPKGRNDEFGDLYKTIDRLRTSIQHAIKRLSAS